MNRVPKDDFVLPPQYSDELSIALLSAEILTTDSYHQPVYAGQFVRAIVSAGGDTCLAVCTRSAGGDFVLEILEGEDKGITASTCRVRWLERVAAVDETIARLSV